MLYVDLIEGSPYRNFPGTPGSVKADLNQETESSKRHLNIVRKDLHRDLSIPDSLKLPSLNLLFHYILGENVPNSEFLKINSKLLDHVYFVKREKYHDGVIFLINDKDKPFLKADEIRAEMNPMLNKIFEHYPDLGKIITIPLKVDSLTDVLKILDTKSKTKRERYNKAAMLQSKLEIGTSQTLYPEHKKNYPNHVKLVLSKFFEEFKQLEQISHPDFDLFVYEVNKGKPLIIDFQDRSNPLIPKQTVNPDKSPKEKYIADLKHLYKDAPILQISTDAQRDLGENFQIGDYQELSSKQKSSSKADPDTLIRKILISASVDNNLYSLELNGKAQDITEISDNPYLKELKTRFENFLPEKTSDRGEKIIQALFEHLGVKTQLMSSNPGHRYDLKLEMDKTTTHPSPLQLLRNNSSKILVEIKASRDDYPSIRSLTVNQATRFQNLPKDQTAIVAKVILNDSNKHPFINVEEIFKDYPPKFIENEDGFAVLKPDLEKSKDRHSPYFKIYLLTFKELQGRYQSGKLKAPATISQLELSINLNEVKDKIAESKGKEIDLRTLGPNVGELERGIYFNNLKKLRNIEQELGKVNNFKNYADGGFAKTFAARSSLREQRQDIMKKLLITQLTKNNSESHSELIEYYSPCLTKLPHITTGNRGIDDNIFIFRKKDTGEIKPYEIMCFSPADPVQQYTQDHLSNRNIFDSSDDDDISRLSVIMAFYDGKNKIHLFKEDLPKKVLERLSSFEDLNDVKRGVHYIKKGSLFKSVEPLGLHVIPKAMIKHSFA
jgi:hypothetical protein